MSGLDAILLALHIQFINNVLRLIAKEHTERVYAGILIGIKV